MPSLVNTNSFPATRAYFRTLEGRAILAVSATALVALCAHLSVPLPFTPVPVTLQTFAVLLIGFLLGPTMGALALTAYLVEGACGLPVFSPHTGVGVATLFGPTGGYLLAYPFAAAIAGSLSNALRRSPIVGYAVGGTVAIAFVLLSGTGYLMALTHMSLHAAWIAAVAPFLPGEVVKICAAAGISRALYRAN
jgi:biotin transport system substrate-specific component